MKLFHGAVILEVKVLNPQEVSIETTRGSIVISISQPSENKPFLEYDCYNEEGNPLYRISWTDLEKPKPLVYEMVIKLKDPLADEELPLLS